MDILLCYANFNTILKQSLIKKDIDIKFISISPLYEVYLKDF